MNKQKKNVVLVLQRLQKMAEYSEDDAEVLSDVLEDVLTDLHSNDFFGTEGQCDPRGDFRNGEWSMNNVEQ